MSAKKAILIFDLDGTVIDSHHRTPLFPDGTLNLAAYIEKHTPENVAKDTLLPLARIMKAAWQAGHEVWVCTARDMHAEDYAFLEKHGLYYHKIFSRDQCKTESHYKMRDGEYKAKWLNLLNLKQYKDRLVVMFDDAKPVMSKLRSKFPVINAIKANRRFPDCPANYFVD